MSPILVNASEGHGGGAGVEPRAAWGAQGVLSRALPWGPACAQPRVRTNHSHVFGTVPFLRALAQRLAPGKGETGLICNCRTHSA